MSSQFASLIGWYFLPGLVTGWIQTGLYTIFTRAGDPKPTPGSPRFVRDRRNIHIFVILAYLLYTIIDADYNLQHTGDFYSDLGVPLDVSIKGLQSRFRRLAAQFHPDKVAASEQAAVAARFVHLQTAKDTLVSPARRFAYDRLGPDVLQWEQCKTTRDFIIRGLRDLSGYYIGTTVALLGTGMLGYLKAGKTWRYLVLAGMFVIELYTVTRPSFPAVLSNVVNPTLLATGVRAPLLPFQMLILLRKLAVTTFIAISQLQPLFANPANQAANGDAVTQQQIDHINRLAVNTDQELSRVLALEMVQYGTSEDSVSALRTSLRDWLVSNTIKNDVEVRNAMARALERRRGETSHE